MAKFKDWEAGEARVKAEIVSPQGANHKYYLPHLTEKAGAAVVVLLSRISMGLPIKVVWTDAGDDREQEILVCQLLDLRS